MSSNIGEQIFAVSARRSCHLVVKRSSEITFNSLMATFSPILWSMLHRVFFPTIYFFRKDDSCMYIYISEFILIGIYFVNNNIYMLLHVRLGISSFPCCRFEFHNSRSTSYNIIQDGRGPVAAIVSVATIRCWQIR